MQRFDLESTKALDDAVGEVRRAETEHLMQMGRLDLAEKIGTILRKCKRPLTPEEEAILDLVKEASTDRRSLYRRQTSSILRTLGAVFLASFSQSNIESRI